VEWQAKSNDELLCRLIKERDRKKLDATSVNHSSSTCAVNFTQTNTHTSGASVGSTPMPNPSVQSVNHFHSRTTIEGLTPTFGVLQQSTINMFGQGYTQTTPRLSTSNFTSVAYTPGGNGCAYAHASGNYKGMYTTVAYTNPISLLSRSLGFLPNHAYQNVLRFNAYGQPKADGFGYETPSQFLFWP
jgi:hypothetical protein